MDQCESAKGSAGVSIVPVDGVCTVCKWGDDEQGNEILLCDGGCNSMFRVRTATST